MRELRLMHAVDASGSSGEFARTNMHKGMHISALQSPAAPAFKSKHKVRKRKSIRSQRATSASLHILTARD